jgi:hypothetical protein
LLASVAVLLLVEDELLVVDELLVEVDDDEESSRSAIVKPVPEDEPFADEEPPGGGPGGGPPAPPGPPGPPCPPPGPPPNVLAKTLCSSVAWLLVSVPFETWSAIRLSILDLMSPGPELLVPVELELELDEEDWSEVSELLMLVNADDNADSSVELIAPDDTSD